MAKNEKTKEQKQKSFFPEIGSTAKIKQCILKPGSVDLRFEELKFSSGQTEQIKGIVDSKEDVMLTISAVQGRLPGM